MLNNLTKTLSTDTVIAMHRIIAERTGGSPELRDIALLESALSSPFQTFGCEQLYPTLIEKAAMLGYGLICNHPFVDGNKRIGMLAMLTFLKINGYELNTSDKYVAHIGLAVAAGEMRCNELLLWLRKAINEQA